MLRIGIDIGGTNIETVIIPSMAQNVDSALYHHCEYPKNADINGLCECLNDCINAVLNKRGASCNEVERIGIAMPGSIDVKNGTVINAYNLNLHNERVTDRLKSRFPNTEICLYNDADAATAGEYKFGALRGFDSCCLITLGTGVGAGIIMNGKLYLGGNMRGTELGHMILQQGGLMCTCKNRGCIETLCSATYIANCGKDVFCDTNMTAKTVFNMAKAGDARALKIFNRYVDNLSSAVASYINLLDPEAIALGGGVSLAGDFLIEPLIKQVKEKVFFELICHITTAQLWDKAGAIGAAFVEI